MSSNKRKGPYLRNASGYRGVTKDNGWRAVIQVNKKAYCLGRYSHPKEAALAYDRAVLEHKQPREKFSINYNYI